MERLTNNGLPTNQAYKGWEIRGLKEGIGHELSGWQGTLYKDSTKVAIIDDDGYGGGVTFYWEYAKKLKRVNGAEEAWNEFCKEERARREADKESWDDFEKKHGLCFDQNILVSDLANLASAVKETKKLCRRNVIVQTDKNMNSMSYNRLPKTYEQMEWEKLKEKLKNSWKVNEIRIVNEEVEA